MQPTAAVFILACLLLVNVEGGPIMPRGRCLCLDAGVMGVRRANIENIVLHQPSGACGKMEIIVSLKSGGHKCLNLKSKMAEAYLEKITEKQSLQ